MDRKNQPCEYVTAELIGSEPMRGRWRAQASTQILRIDVIHGYEASEYGQRDQEQYGEQAEDC